MSRREKPTRQVSFREEEELVAKVLEAANREELPVADFVRKLFRLAFRRYQDAGSLYSLRKLESPTDAAARQAEIERRVARGPERSSPQRKKRVVP
jgi:hypothetical protein